MEERLGFDYRAFAAKHGLDASTGGGVFMWREVWDETVSRIHAETLSAFFLRFCLKVTVLMCFVFSRAETEEPVFGRMPKEDPYAFFKTTKRYH